jgi:hypothetical protein
MITSYSWSSYAREVPKEKYLFGKIFTQRIERNNLILRTHYEQGDINRSLRPLMLQYLLLFPIPGYLKSTCIS